MNKNKILLGIILLIIWSSTLTFLFISTIYKLDIDIEIKLPLGILAFFIFNKGYNLIKYNLFYTEK